MGESIPNLGESGPDRFELSVSITDSKDDCSSAELSAPMGPAKGPGPEESETLFMKDVKLRVIFGACPPTIDSGFATRGMDGQDARRNPRTGGGTQRGKHTSTVSPLATRRRAGGTSG